MKSSYRTVKGAGKQEIVVQRSRFIGYARPCETEDEALQALRTIREVHRDASHHCYAYIIGQNEGIMRYSDDGEPGGTAGQPMLSTLRAEGIVNCLVVAVRYFGGILLGTGGLVRAYTQICQAALRAACIVTREWSLRFFCEVPYNVWDSVRYAAERLPVSLSGIEYGAAVSFTLAVRSADEEYVLDALQKASGRKLDLIPIEEGYELWETGSDQ